MALSQEAEEAVVDWCIEAVQRRTPPYSDQVGLSLEDWKDLIFVSPWDNTPE